MDKKGTVNIHYFPIENVLAIKRMRTLLKIHITIMMVSDKVDEQAYMRAGNTCKVITIIIQFIPLFMSCGYTLPVSKGLSMSNTGVRGVLMVTGAFGI